MGFVLPHDEDVVDWDSYEDECDADADLHGVCETGADDDECADDEEGQWQDDADADGSLEVRPCEPHPKQASDRCQREKSLHSCDVHDQGLNVV